MEKMKDILFTVITSIIFLGIAALGIIGCVNEDVSLIAKILSVTVISVLACGFDLALNLYWWGVI